MNPEGWSAGEKAGAVLLLIVALGLGFIAGDILFSGKLFKRGCCQDDDREAGTVEH